MNTNVFQKLLISLFLLLFSINIFANGKKVALIWGNSTYYGQWQSLQVTENDANTMNRILTSLGFQTKILHDGDLKQMESSLREFSSMAKGADIAIFYYSGHATRINEGYYLVPAKTDLGNELLVSNFFPAQDILTIVGKSRLRLLFFDSCRDEAVIEGITKGNPNIVSSQDVGPLNGEDNHDPSGTMICYAAERGKKAYTGVGSLSTFTKVLSEHITDGDEFRTVWANVIDEVYMIQKQRPVNDGFYQHDLYLNPTGRKHIAPSQDITQVTTQKATNKKSILIVPNVSSAKIDFYGTTYEVGSPLEFEIGNTYTYTITSNGYKPYVGSLKVTDSTPSTINVIMQKNESASLKITSNTGAKVYLDGTLIGIAPITVNTTSGAHSLRLSANNYLDYSSSLDLESGTNTKHIILTPKKPWFVDWNDADAPAGYVSYLFNPKFQIGLQYLHRFEDTRFLLGANVAISTGLFKGIKVDDVTSVATSSEASVSVTENGNPVGYKSSTITTSYEPDEYTEAIDPDHKATHYDSNFMFLITGGYQPCNGMLLETGFGVASHCDKYYLPYSLSQSKTITTNSITGEIIGEPKYDYVRENGSTWIKEKVKWSPAMRLGMKFNIPVSTDLFLAVGGGYTHIFSNTACSSWDASLGIAWCY